MQNLLFKDTKQELFSCTFCLKGEKKVGDGTLGEVI